jgi:hypothetical protein
MEPEKLSDDSGVTFRLIPEPATQDDGNPTARNNPIEKARQQSFVVEQASTVGVP